MRRIDIFVSSPADVQKERRLAERLIRSVATEFNVPVHASYSNWLKKPRKQDEIPVDRANVPDESPLVCAYFWEHQGFKAQQDYREHFLNTRQFDLVICILWSQLGTKLPPTFVTPDGSQPASATDYEVAWVLDQSKRTPGSPALHIYRNRSTPAAPLEPKEERETLFRQWDSVQEFFAAWKKKSRPEFAEACHDYQDLEEFEDSFRDHFRGFLTSRLGQEIVPQRSPPRKARYRKSNPFRGLNFFDFEHAPIFHGRTKAIGEVLDALKKQASAKRPFVLVLGASGSGKSSLVRAGVVPLLIQVGTVEGDGPWRRPWRRAVTRPGAGCSAGDPFDALAAALLDKSALPELQDSRSPNKWRSLASELRKDPNSAALRLKETLDHLSLQELDYLLHEQECKLPPAKTGEGAELARSMSLGRVKPKVQLVLVVDQLEELFTGGFSPELQQRYIAALSALVRCEEVSVIATLRSDLYVYYQQFGELVELTARNGRFDLHPPTPHEIGKMIRLPAAVADLCFEQDPDTGQSLDEALLDAALASPEPLLPLLEHLLSRLYQKQLERNDGLLRWSDYRELGKFERVLTNHAETVFSTLKTDEQGALEFVMRHLVTLSRREGGVLNRRTILYRDLVSSRELDDRQKAGAKGLVDCFIKEGLLSADTDPNQEVIVSISHETLLRTWPRVWQRLSEDQEFLRMRDRLDTSVKPRLVPGDKDDHLLGPGIIPAEGQILTRDVGSSSTGSQIDYIQGSLAWQKRRRRKRADIALTVIAALPVLATVAGVQLFNADIQRKKAEEYAKLQRRIAEPAENQRDAAEAQRKRPEEDVQQAQQNADVAANQHNALETELKNTQAKAQQAQKDAALATSQRDTLQTELKDAEATAQQARENGELAASQRDTLQAQLADNEARAQQTQKNAELAPSERDTLQAELKDAESKAQLAQKNGELAASQRDALQAQLKDTESRAQLAQKNADLAASERDALQAQLKEAQQAQKNGELAASQRDALQAQLKDAEATAQQAQKDAALAVSQRDALQGQLKDTETKAQQVQTNARLASSQRDMLQTQLRNTEATAQQAQKDVTLAANQRDALQLQLKDTEAKAQQAQKEAALAASQRDALQTQLKDTEAKAQQALKNGDLAAGQRDALQAQLKDTEAKAQLVRKIADLVAAQSNVEEAGSLKEEPVKNNADLPANQLKSGRALPLDSGQNAETMTSLNR